MSSEVYTDLERRLMDRALADEVAGRTFHAETSTEFRAIEGLWKRGVMESTGVGDTVDDEPVMAFRMSPMWTAARGWPTIDERRARGRSTETV